MVEGVKTHAFGIGSVRTGNLSCKKHRGFDSHRFHNTASRKANVRLDGQRFARAEITAPVTAESLRKTGSMPATLRNGLLAAVLLFFCVLVLIFESGVLA